MASTGRAKKIPKIEGYPVWKLSGVSSANAHIVKETGFWIHYRRLGDDGWGIAAPETLRNALLPELRKHGIKAAPWEKLPKRSPVGMYSFIAIWVFCAVLYAISSPFNGWIPVLLVASVFLWPILGGLFGSGFMRCGRFLQDCDDEADEMYNDGGITGYMGFPVKRD